MPDLCLLRYWLRVEAMQKFEIKALTESGLVEVWAVEAVDESAARRLATERGADVITARAIGGGGFSPGRRQRRFPIILFTHELLSLLEAGVRLQAALETLARKERTPSVRRVLEAVVADLTRGRRMSDALSGQPEAFPPLYVATVRASEKTGDLREALQRFVGYLERVELLKRKVVSALIYPAVLLSVGGLVVLFLMLYVIPRFSSVYGRAWGEPALGFPNPGRVGAPDRFASRRRGYRAAGAAGRGCVRPHEARAATLAGGTCLAHPAFG